MVVFLVVVISLTMLASTRSFTRGVSLAASKITPKAYTAPKSSVMWMSSGGEDTVVARCTQKSQDAPNPSKLVVNAAHDNPNGSHISVEVVSDMFEGKRSVQRQRLVYQAIWDEMKDGGAVHAVDSIVAQTPNEAA